MAVLGDRGEPETGVPATASALVTLLARGLGLARVALLMADDSGATLVPVASHGRVRIHALAVDEAPGDGPWSLVLPLATASGPGLLLLARADGAPLPPADRVLAERLTTAAAGVLAHDRLAADLAHARALLARADRLAALGTLAAGVAHEIRNPLVSVQTFIQLLPERLHDEEFRTGFRRLALDEIDRICALINDLLSFSRPAPAQREPADLNELVEQIVRLLDAEARKQDVTMTRAGAAALPTVVVDDSQVKQVLLNVILNAIQACPPHGTVTITTGTTDPRWCVVQVADSGGGIAPEHRHQIFEPFFTTKDAGSGLGLFIARQIITEHGGHITVVPREGGGAVFAIHFPLTGEAHAGSR